MATKTIKKAVEEVKEEKIMEPVAAAVVDVVDMDDMGEMPEISEKEIAAKPDKYYEATGRRKTAVARVRLFTRGEKQFLVNGKPYQEYFPLAQDQDTVTASMRKMKCLDKFKVTVLVNGGGRSAQAEAVRHGTARVLVDFNNNFKKRLRKVGYLTRDPRMRERKKFGLKRARKSPQWAKR
ncbi:MAG TPA: 30S ribosomal protein S9 [Negativicutes bacterium]|nr:30S ribosomal protein S9 [Negativicutes bacterium]